MKRSEWAAQLGYSQEQWGVARDEVREAILEAARDRTMTNYTDVSANVTAIPVTPRSPVLFHLLGEVLEEEYKTTGLALTALVVHKAGDMAPASSRPVTVRNVAKNAQPTSARASSAVTEPMRAEAGTTPTRTNTTTRSYGAGSSKPTPRR